MSGLSVQALHDTVKALHGHALYARIMGAADADRAINAALAACRAALAAVRLLPRQHQRIEAAQELYEHLRGYSEEAAHIRAQEVIRIWEADRPSYGELGKRAGVSKSLAAQIIKRHKQERAKGAAEAPRPSPAAVTEPDVMEEPMIDVNAPLRPAIVAAIITSKEGVLIERRHDGRPLYTFPAGEAEPGESPGDTAIRETKEETGLQIVVSHVLGERNHPKTGRHMIYLAARPYQGTGVHNGDEAELAEVRWVNLTEAEELLTGMYEPVLEHLRSTLG
jgi:8-oxo-dGTP diphosphatase